MSPLGTLIITHIYTDIRVRKYKVTSVDKEVVEYFRDMFSRYDELT